MIILQRKREEENNIKVSPNPAFQGKKRRQFHLHVLGKTLKAASFPHREKTIGYTNLQ